MIEHEPHRGRASSSAASPAAALALAAATLLAGARPALAQDPAAEARALEERLEAGRRDGLHLVAPERFERAEERLREARARLSGGDPAEEVREPLVEGRLALRAAERLAEDAGPAFERALAARARALDAGAPTRLPDRWAEAEDALRDAGERFEDGDAGEAAVRADRTIALYERLALEARRRDVLGGTITARDRALAEGAGELAPETFAEAEDRLARAERRLAAGPEGREEAARLGDGARALYERSRAIAALADSVARRRVPAERLVRERRADLEALAAAAGLEPGPAASPAEIRAGLADEIERLRTEVRELREELASARAEQERLGRRAEDVQAELEALAGRHAEAVETLRERERRAERLREVEALFSPEEGEVLLSGDRLLLRLPGLAFESGEDEILPSHEPLLTKVMRVLREFPDATVRIEGHTDARGDAGANRALSQRRAIAVREYLLSRLPISADRVEAVGIGEARPIASNDTEEGRERNRRIEIVLGLGAG